MLAIRLHKTKNPKLNKGCYLVPIFKWKVDEGVIKAWVKVLNKSNKGRPNNNINYITLVTIPDNFPIYIAGDWSDKIFVGAEMQFEPVKDQTALIKELHDNNTSDAWLQELVLGDTLPKKNIKWTKDIRKLWGKKKKKFDKSHE